MTKRSVQKQSSIKQCSEGAGVGATCRKPKTPLCKYARNNNNNKRSAKPKIKITLFRWEAMGIDLLSNYSTGTLDLD